MWDEILSTLKDIFWILLVIFICLLAQEDGVH